MTVVMAFHWTKSTIITFRQIALFEYTYCDFVCWTTLGLHAERIYYDPEFVGSMMPELDEFFLKVVLPEVLCDGKDESTVTEEVFCYCHQTQLSYCRFWQSWK